MTAAKGPDMELRRAFVELQVISLIFVFIMKYIYPNSNQMWIIWFQILDQNGGQQTKDENGRFTNRKL